MQVQQLLEASHPLAQAEWTAPEVEKINELIPGAVHQTLVGALVGCLVGVLVGVSVGCVVCGRYLGAQRSTCQFAACCWLPYILRIDLECIASYWTLCPSAHLWQFVVPQAECFARALSLMGAASQLCLLESLPS